VKCLTTPVISLFLSFLCNQSTSHDITTVQGRANVLLVMVMKSELTKAEKPSNLIDSIYAAETFNPDDGARRRFNESVF